MTLQAVNTPLFYHLQFIYFSLLFIIDKIWETNKDEQSIQINL